MINKIPQYIFLAKDEAPRIVDIKIFLYKVLRMKSYAMIDKDSEYL